LPNVATEAREGGSKRGAKKTPKRNHGKRSAKGGVRDNPLREERRSRTRAATVELGKEFDAVEPEGLGEHYKERGDPLQRAPSVFREEKIQRQARNKKIKKVT